jgi:TRAP transporter TAXI family solute receptor
MIRKSVFSSLVVAVALLLGSSAFAQWNISVVGSPAGGTLQVKAEGVGEALRRGVAKSNVSVPTSSPGAGLALIGTGKAEVAVGASARMAVNALRGNAPFKQKYKFNLLAFWGADLFMFVATPKAGLKTFGDYVSKKAKDGISVGPPGSGSYMVFDDVAQVHGTNFKAMEAWGAKIHYQYSAPSLELLQDGQIEGLGGLWGQPSSRIVDLTNNREMVWVGLDKEAIDKLGAEFGYEYVMLDSPGDFGYGYKFVNKEPLHTVRMADIVCIRSDLSVDQAYAITKAIFGSKKYLTSVHKSFVALTEANTVALDKASKALSLHEGTVKYFKEVGAM